MPDHNPTQNPLVSTNIQVRTEDLVAIQVAEFEHKLLTRQVELEANIRDIKKSIKTIEDSINVEVKAIGEKTFDTKPLVAELVKVGMKAKAKVEAALNEDHISVRLVISKEDGYGGSFDSVKKVPVPKDMKASLNKVQSEKEALTTEQSNLVDVRRQLSQISTIERQARSSIAKNTLSKMEGGDDLLASMGNIPGLPQLPAPKKSK